ncbi:hypothetical protein [Streptosporangium subroseum]|uniref:hypothetical protein n=1 Tax=Streptosporangium subroseum TaxID=106412 RepID=UPI00308D44AF|nr:hypothetical protein OHB15_21805 [Streptosporangium subroseum]
MPSVSASGFFRITVISLKGQTQKRRMIFVVRETLSGASQLVNEVISAGSIRTVGI